MKRVKFERSPRGAVLHCVGFGLESNENFPKLAATVVDGVLVSIADDARMIRLSKRGF